MTAAAHDTAIPDFVRTITTRTPCAKNPNRWQSTNETDQTHARRSCAICPHETACRQWAIERPEEIGMWGGLTGHQRAALRTKQRKSRDEQRVRVQCPCGRFVGVAATGPYCYAHPDGVPLLTPRLIETLEAALDGARMVEVGQRLGISLPAVEGRLKMIYRRLGVGEMHPARRLAAAVEAARAAGVLAAEQGVAA